MCPDIVRLVRITFVVDAWMDLWIVISCCCMWERMLQQQLAATTSTYHDGESNDQEAPLRDNAGGAKPVRKQQCHCTEKHHLQTRLQDGERDCKSAFSPASINSFPKLRLTTAQLILQKLAQGPV